MTNRQSEPVHHENHKDAQRENPETTSNEKGRENRLARKAFLLPSERKHKDQGGVEEKNQDTPMPDRVQGKRSGHETLKLKKQEQVKSKNKQDRCGSQKIQIGTGAVGVRTHRGYFQKLNT